MNIIFLLNKYFLLDEVKAENKNHRYYNVV